MTNKYIKKLETLSDQKIQCVLNIEVYIFFPLKLVNVDIALIPAHTHTCTHMWQIHTPFLRMMQRDKSICHWHDLSDKFSILPFYF